MGKGLTLCASTRSSFRKFSGEPNCRVPSRTLPARPTVTGCWGSRCSPLALCEGKEPIRSEAKTGCCKPEKGERRPAGRAGEERGRSGEGPARRRPAPSASGAPDTRGGSRGGAGLAAEGPARGGGRRAGVRQAAARDVAPGRALSAAGPRRGTRRGTRGDSGRRRPVPDGRSPRPRARVPSAPGLRPCRRAPAAGRHESAAATLAPAPPPGRPGCGDGCAPQGWGP